MPDEKDFYKALMDSLHEGVYFVDRERTITYWNKGAERITGYPSHRVLGRACHDSQLNHVSADGVPLCGENCLLAASMQDGLPREAEVYLRHADGFRVPVVLRATPVRNEQGEIIGAVESFYNNERVLATRRALLDLRRAAHIDPLTGVSNRRHLEGRLRAAIVEAGHTKAGVGLLFIDVDRFKEFNDRHGHETGDRVLSLVANNLRLNLRTTDTVGRWAGDEFLAILSNVQDKQHLRWIAIKLTKLIEFSRLDLEDKNLSVTISVGGTLLLPEDTAETFLQRADKLMYSSKKLGRNFVAVG